jgi:hypothetical protein
MLTQEQIEDLGATYAYEFNTLKTQSNINDWLLENLDEKLNATMIQRMEIARLALKILYRFATEWKANDFRNINKQYLHL